MSEARNSLDLLSTYAGVSADQDEIAPSAQRKFGILARQGREMGRGDGRRWMKRIGGSVRRALLWDFLGPFPGYSNMNFLPFVKPFTSTQADAGSNCSQFLPT